MMSPTHVVDLPTLVTRFQLTVNSGNFFCTGSLVMLITNLLATSTCCRPGWYLTEINNSELDHTVESGLSHSLVPSDLEEYIFTSLS